jgi:acetate kinase
VRVLVVNAGSSSLKLRLLGPRDELEQSADLTSGPAGFDREALADVLRRWTKPDAVGHRIVHGGDRYAEAVRIDPEVTRHLGDLTDLAPLHQPKSLAALDAFTAEMPEVPSFACFDTAFHATIPPAASTYAIPRAWREKYAIRRYGFHGLSHAYASARAADLLGRPPDGLRIVTCHLGAGASLAAVLGGRSVDTTMGFTPLEGLVMATRSGTVDPGLVLWIQEHEQLSAHELVTALEQRSGLLALAGNADLAAVVHAARRGDPDAALAVDVYVHHLVAGVAAMTAALGGLDVLVFTGGVGEHSAEVRRRAAERLGYLGVRIQPDALREGDYAIDAADAPVRTFVITAREDLQIAREVRALMTFDSGAASESSRG